MTEEKRQLLIDNAARNIELVAKNIKYRHAVHCYLADHDYGEKISSAMKLDINKVKSLSLYNNTELIQSTMDFNMQ